MSRRIYSFLTFGALGAAVSIAACSSSSNPTGFDNSSSNNSNGGGGNGSSGSSRSGSSGSGTGNGYGGSTSNKSTSGGNGGGGSSSTGGSNGGGSSSAGGSTGAGGGGGSSTGAGSSSGGGSTGTGGGGGGGCGDAGACSVTAAAGAIPLTSCYQSSVGGGGYAFAYNDGMSTACLDSTAFCGGGTLTIAGSSPSAVGGYFFGAAIGVNLNQPQGSSTTGPLTPDGGASGGLTVQFSSDSVAPYGIQIQVKDTSGQSYCTELTTLPTTSAKTIMWSSFNTLCYNMPPDGGTYSPTTGIVSVAFQANSGAASKPWNLCVTELAVH